MFSKSVLLMFILFVILSLAMTQCRPQLSDPAAQPVAAADHDDPDDHITDLAALQPVSLELDAGQKLRVVATTNIVGDVVSNLGGEAIDLTLLLPLGADPHTFVPSPRDVTAVADAHLIFINGLGLEAFLEELIENAGGQAVVISVSAGVETRQFGQNEDQSEGQDESQNEGHEADEDDDAHHHSVDPHTWMSPANVMVWIHNIEGALRALDPANGGTYEANATTYETELETLDTWVKEQLASIPAENRKLVTDHDTFGYYVDRYDLELVGAVIPAYSTNAEPSAQELAALQRAITGFGAKAIFVGTTVNSKLAEQAARDSGVRLAPLYTGSLGQAGSGAETYLDYMRYNTTAIVEALK